MGVAGQPVGGTATRCCLRAARRTPFLERGAQKPSSSRWSGSQARVEEYGTAAPIPPPPPPPPAPPKKLLQSGASGGAAAPTPPSDRGPHARGSSPATGRGGAAAQAGEGGGASCRGDSPLGGGGGGREVSIGTIPPSSRTRPATATGDGPPPSTAAAKRQSDGCGRASVPPTSRGTGGAVACTPHPAERLPSVTALPMARRWPPPLPPLSPKHQLRLRGDSPGLSPQQLGDRRGGGVPAWRGRGGA